MEQLQAGSDRDIGHPWWERSDRNLIRQVFLARHCGFAAVAVLIPFVSTIGDRRSVLVAIVVLVVLPIDLSFARRARRAGRFSPAMPVANVALAVGIGLFVPAVVPAIAALLVADTALAALAFDRRLALALTGAGSLGLLLVAAVTDAGSEEVTVAVYPVASAATAWMVGRLGEREREGRQRFQALLDEVDVVVWEMVPGTNRFEYVSPAAGPLLELPVAHWYGPGFWAEHLHPDDAAAALATLEEAVAHGADHQPEYRMEYRMVGAEGKIVHVHDVATMHRDASGRVTTVRGVIFDVTDRHRSEELLRQQATHDSLTGLPNRSLFADRLDQALREARRTGDRVALLLLDLDDFKEVNDALGHDAGDRLLAAFAHRLRHEVRDCDTIARLGGDEFGLLLTVDADGERATTVAHRVLAVAERPVEVDGLDLQVAVSLGIALFPDHATDPPTLSARADVAMYLAKRSGTGVALYEPELDSSSVRRLSLLGNLREAIASEQLVLEFQPSFDLRTGRVAAVEALVRWDHPEHGRIGPEDFIRLAEMSGLIEPLTRWVIAEALRVVPGLAPGLAIAANLSVRNLVEPDLVDWLSQQLATGALAPERLVLELTESEVMADVESASAVLGRIRALGIRLAVDDFGAGQSSLAYLRTLPIDELKIDRVLVEGVGRDADLEWICATVVGLAHRLGLQVVAEGASDLADVAALRRMGCDRAQGFSLGPPVPASALPGLLGCDHLLDPPPES